MANKPPRSAANIVFIILLALALLGTLDFAVHMTISAANPPPPA